MKIYFFILYFIPILWIGCGSVQDLSNPDRPPLVKTDRGPLYVYPGTKIPYNGEFSMSFEDGEKLKFGIKDGVKHGRFQRWYPSGQIHEEYNLFKKQRHGLQRSWYPNGQLRLEANFRKGICINAKTWTISGAIASTVEEGTGIMVLFHADGKKDRESIYKDGIKIN